MKKLYLLLLSMIVLMSISCAFASDNTNETIINHDVSVDETTTANLENDVDNITFNEKLNNNMNVPANVSYESIQESGNVLGDFDELNDNIQNLSPGDVYNIDKDYSFNGEINQSKQFITIDKDNITINGNDHSIDGQYHSGLFKITANNVKIYNLTFINFEFQGVLITTPTNSTEKSCDDKTFYTYTKKYSPIEWLGDNGVISGCTFHENSAINGGALSWSGNNGIIDNCLFIDNIAQGVGGAIYIGGANNSIINSIFVNSSSQLSREAIYIDYKRENITLKNNAYKDCILYIDGVKTNIDVSYMKYSLKSPVADESINLVPLVYNVLTNGNLSYLDNGMMYYGEYDNNNQEFTLHITKYFGDISFTKNYKFKRIVNVNDIFYDMIYNGDYENTMTFVKSIEIFSSTRLEDDYVTAISTSVKCFNNIIAYLFNYDQTCLFDSNTILANTVRHEYPISFGLNINFCESLTINCNHEFDLNAGGFDIVNINGHGTKIYTSSSDSDENKWAVLEGNKILSVSDLIIEGYNTAIKNLGGECILNSITFNHNRMDYWICKDYGAAIQSTGIVDCKNCTFTTNYAKYGGAIFSQGIINLKNCYFSGNFAYGKGNNVCIGEGGIAIVNNVETNYDTDIITHCDKTLEENVIVKYIDFIKKSSIGDLDGDVDIGSIYPYEVHTEGLKLMSIIYSGSINKLSNN